MRLRYTPRASRWMASGVLLCGDSGAGKSTLSYACARSGWTYVTDDCSFLLNSGTKRLVTGNCHQVRFRPSAAEFFPEVRGLEITPRAVGKPSIELPTAPMKHITLAQSAKVDFIVFLNRHTGRRSFDRIARRSRGTSCGRRSMDRQNR